MAKSQKVKDKEIYNLGKKDLNQQETIKKLKDENNKLKGEKLKAEKEIKKLKKNLEEKPYEKDQNQNKIDNNGAETLLLKLKCEICGERFKTHGVQENHLLMQHEDKKFCHHEKQCIFPNLLHPEH